MVPVVSSSPSPSPGPPRSMQSGLQQPPRGAPRPMQRPILPKPMHPQHPQHPHDPVGEGRQGAILDVKSIIADYRYIVSIRRNAHVQGVCFSCALDRYF